MKDFTYCALTSLALLSGCAGAPEYNPSFVFQGFLDNKSIVYEENRPSVLDSVDGHENRMTINDNNNHQYIFIDTSADRLSINSANFGNPQSVDYVFVESSKFEGIKLHTRPVNYDDLDSLDGTLFTNADNYYNHLRSEIRNAVSDRYRYDLKGKN